MKSPTIQKRSNSILFLNCLFWEKCFFIFYNCRKQRYVASSSDESEPEVPSKIVVKLPAKKVASKSPKAAEKSPDSKKSPAKKAAASKSPAVEKPSAAKKSPSPKLTFNAKTAVKKSLSPTLPDTPADSPEPKAKKAAIQTKKEDKSPAAKVEAKNASGNLTSLIIYNILCLRQN